MKQRVQAMMVMLMGMGPSGCMDNNVLTRLGEFDVVDTGTGVDLYSVWGSRPGAMWAVGAEATVLFWDGKKWEAKPHPLGQQKSITFHRVWGLTEDNAWTVGTEGTVMHWDGNAWTQVAFDPGGTLHDVWGPSSNVIFVVGEAGVWKWNGTWNRVPTSLDQEGGRPSWRGVWGVAEDDFMVVGDQGLFTWNNSWLGRRDFKDEKPSFTAVGGADSTIAWMVGSARLTSWNGETIHSCYGFPTNLRAIWANSAEDMWVVGGQDGRPEILHLGEPSPLNWAKEELVNEECQWQRLVSWDEQAKAFAWGIFINKEMKEEGKGELLGVWGADTHVWAVGQKGLAMHSASNTAAPRDAGH